jgi:hypothetical protein
MVVFAAMERTYFIINPLLTTSFLKYPLTGLIKKAMRNTNLLFPEFISIALSGNLA